MKLKLKKLLHLILFSSLLFLQSCQKEELLSEKQKIYNIKQVPFSTLMKSQSFSNAFNKVQKQNLDNHNRTNKSTVMEHNNNFTIVDTPANVTENDSIFIYTLLIKRDTLNEKIVENLILNTNKLTNKTSAYILKYQSNSKIISLENFTGKINITPIIFDDREYVNNNYNSLFANEHCFEVYVVSCSNPNTDTHTAGGAGCAATPHPITVCVYSSGGGGTGSDYSNPTGSGTDPYGNTQTGGSSGGSIVTAPVNPVELTPTQNFIGDLNPQQYAWWTNPANQAAVRKIEYYLNSNNYSMQSVQFANWTINYLAQNTNVTWQQFQNWFMGSSEGTDGDYDATFWNNPSLTFPLQNLPSWNNYYNAFPHHTDGSGMTADEVYTLVGGIMRDNHFSSNPTISSKWQNACAIRVSRALNYSGIIIPQMTGTFKGDDNKNYFVNAKSLNTWMRKTFGVAPINPNHKHITSTMAGINGVNLPNLLKDNNLSTPNNPVYIKGIFSLVSSNPNWASGHADCLQANGECVNRCHFYDAPIDYIDVWILN